MNKAILKSIIIACLAIILPVAAGAVNIQRTLPKLASTGAAPQTVQFVSNILNDDSKIITDIITNPDGASNYQQNAINVILDNLNNGNALSNPQLNALAFNIYAQTGAEYGSKALDKYYPSTPVNNATLTFNLSEDSQDPLPVFEGLSAIGGDKKATFVWTAQPGVNYSVYRHDDGMPNGYYERKIPDAVSGCIDNNLTNGTIYQYILLAKDAQGRIIHSSSYDVVPQEAPNPEAPTIGAIPDQNATEHQTLTIKFNVTDDGKALTFEKLKDVEHGTLTFNDNAAPGENSATYNPDNPDEPKGDWTGDVTFKFWAKDEGGECSNQVAVTIHVKAVHDAPKITVYPAADQTIDLGDAIKPIVLSVDYYDKLDTKPADLSLSAYLDYDPAKDLPLSEVIPANPDPLSKKLYWTTVPSKDTPGDHTITFKVTDQSGGMVEKTLQVVIKKKLNKVAIAPKGTIAQPINITAGSEYQFTASGYYNDGTGPEDITTQENWTTDTSDTSGYMDISVKGKLHAPSKVAQGKSVTVTVPGTLPLLTDTSIINIIPGALSSMDIKEKNGIKKAVAGQAGLDFDVIDAKDVNFNTVEVTDADVTWIPQGNFNEDGAFTASNTAGGVQIWAEKMVGNKLVKSLKYPIPVEPYKLSTVEVTLSTVEAAPGQLVSITKLTGKDQYGNPILPGDLKWNNKSSELIPANAPYGPYTITREVEDSRQAYLETKVTGKAIVNVSKVVSSVVISPKLVDIIVGETQQFSVMAFYNDGTNGDVTSLVTWESTSAGTWDAVTKGLLYAKTFAGTGYKVSVEYNKKTDTAIVNLIAGPIASLTIKETKDSYPVKVTAGGELEFDVKEAKDKYLNKFPYPDGHVKWAPEDYFSNTSGHFIAPKKGTSVDVYAWKQVGDNLVKSNEIKVEILPDKLFKAVLITDKTVVNPGDTVYINDVNGYDVNDNLIKSMYLLKSKSSEKIPADAAFGSYTISCTVEDTRAAYAGTKVTGTAIVNVSKEVSSVEVSPKTVDIIAGETQPFSVKAYYNDGTDGDVTQSATWPTNSAGTWDAETKGLLYAKTFAGTGYKVSVEYNKKTDTAIVNLIAGPIASLTIKETKDSYPVKVTAGKTLEFDVKKAADKNGNAVVVLDTEVTWKPAEYFGNSGSFTAPKTAGKVKVWAEKAVGQKNLPSNTIEVTVLTDKLATVEISADKLQALPGETVKISAKGYDQYKNEITGSLIWKPTLVVIPGDAKDQYSVEVTVTDTKDDTSVKGSLNISVINEGDGGVPVNTAPVATPQEKDKAVITSEEIPVTITLSGTDAEDKKLENFVVVGDLPQELTYGKLTKTAKKNEVVYQPNKDANGTDSFSFTVTDSGDTVSSPANVEIKILPVNDKPVLSKIGDQIIAKEQEYTLYLLAEDVDSGDTLAYSADKLPDGAKLDSQTGVFTWTPAEEAAPSITFSVKDLSGAAASETITITVVKSEEDVAAEKKKKEEEEAAKKAEEEKKKAEEEAAKKAEEEAAAKKAEEEKKAADEAKKKAKEEAAKKAEEEKKTEEVAQKKAGEEAAKKAEEEKKTEEVAQKKAEEEAAKKAEEEKKAADEAKKKADLEASVKEITISADNNVAEKKGTIELKVKAKDSDGKEVAISKKPTWDVDSTDIKIDENGKATVGEKAKEGKYTVTAALEVGGKVIIARSEIYVNHGAPSITATLDGKPVAKDMVSNTKPKFTIALKDGNGLKDYKVYVDSKLVNKASVSEVESLVTSASYTPELELTPGTHEVIIEAEDLLGSKSTTSFSVKVYATLELTGQPMNYPNPFKPGVQSTTINYTLTRDTEVKLLIYNITGRIVYSQVYASGSTGGKIGENEITWDGKSFAGETLGNGVYVYFLTSGGKKLGSGEISISE